ncbi:MEDS domain-containing protein [Paradesertivirga mongoliensis]|uniref:MEDS domain-containing protein n=1 Tax=Paradesertivirga mongoliensis TaxID=2100740 RepID=UPI00210BAD81|nr:MEDS domain-containing protein [Pedobacter mongoliensis]
MQIYENDDAFLELLMNFVGEGINSDESVIVIATDVHLKGLEFKLASHGLNVESLVSNHQYFPLNAEEILSKFMRSGWPDEELFMTVVTDLIKKAKAGDKKVRAFGEMVAILWAEGNSGATVNLEHLWNKLCQKEVFCLFCAYPKSGFTQGNEASMQHICDSHTRMVKGKPDSKDEILYKTIQSAKISA